MKNPISITAIASISALGSFKDEIWNNYLTNDHFFKKEFFNGADEWVAPISAVARNEIDTIRSSDAKYKNLDDSVLFALYASRQAVKNAGWSIELNSEAVRIGINIGSSRGATSLFEKYHQEFLEKRKSSTLSSPTTTLGNISSWVAHDLGTQGPDISHSITCSTALHALLNGVAWISSGMTDRFLVGGSEAPLTPFTIAQMKALKIYSSLELDIEEHHGSQGFEGNNRKAELTQPKKVKPVPHISQNIDTKAESALYPCQALNFNKNRNTMILGEGAAVACLERGIPDNALAVIEGIGYATELLRHNTSISADAQCFQRSMQMALGETHLEEIDVIVMHAPGTIKGDSSEHQAIQKVFGENIPSLTTNKWKMGHTFGASGMLSVELAVFMLQHQSFIRVPFVVGRKYPKKIEKVLVNAVGFGGNAVSVLLKDPFSDF